MSPATKFRLRHGLAHAPLQHRIDVGQKQKLRVAIGVGNFGLEAGKDIQLGLVRLGFVEVVEIRAFPEKGFAGGVLNAGGIDLARIKDGLLARAEVFADDGDHAHIGEKAGGQRKVSGRAGEAALPAPGGCFDSVKCNAAHNGNCHA